MTQQTKEESRIYRFRRKLYEVLEKDKRNSRLSRLYDAYILILVILSAIPLMLKLWTAEIVLLDQIVTILFIVDYLLRWMTADFIPKLRDRRVCFVHKALS